MNLKLQQQQIERERAREKQLNIVYVCCKLSQWIQANSLGGIEQMKQILF